MIIKPIYQKNGITLYHGDFRQFISTLPKVDIIVTDPPWANKFLSLYKDLALCAKKVLKPKAFILVYTGNHNLPKVFSYFLEAGFSYYHSFAVLQYLSRSVYFSKRLGVKWIPVPVFCNGLNFKRNGMLINDAQDSPQDKSHHSWGTPAEPLLKWIPGFASPGQTLLDPFMGGGTSIIAAKLSGLKAIGIDIDQKAVRTVINRLEDKTISDFKFKVPKRLI